MATNAMAVPVKSLGLRYYLRLFRQEARYEFVKMLRTRAFSLSVIGFPVMFYLLFGAANRHNEFARYLVASYSCMGMISACLFGLGTGISMDRAYGWLELKQASPMPRMAYIGAKILTCAAFAAIIVAILLALGTTMGGVKISMSEIAHLYAVALPGVLPFASMGLLIALLVPANAAPGIINLIYLPMSFASGIWMPITTLPHWLQEAAVGLPTYHYAQIVLNIFGFAQPGSMLVHWEALAGFTCLMLGAAWLVFTRGEAKA